MIPLELHPDRLFPADPATRQLARTLYQAVRDLPIVSPHGHTDPQWFADNAPFRDPSALLIVPDHYVFRMLYSQGVSLDAFGSRAATHRRRARRTTRGGSGGCSHNTTRSFAGRRLACGSIMHSIPSSASASA